MQLPKTHSQTIRFFREEKKKLLYFDIWKLELRNKCLHWIFHLFLISLCGGRQLEGTQASEEDISIEMHLKKKKLEKLQIYSEPEDSLTGSRDILLNTNI